MSETCPHCGSGDIEALLNPPAASDPFADVPAAHRRCLVCGVRWELDELDDIRGGDLRAGGGRGA